MEVDTPLSDLPVSLSEIEIDPLIFIMRAVSPHSARTPASPQMRPTQSLQKQLRPRRSWLAETLKGLRSQEGLDKIDLG